MPEVLRRDMLEEPQLERLFCHIVMDGTGMLDKERFVAMLTRLAYRVERDTVLTQDKSIKSKVCRRLEAGEVVEELGIPEIEGENVRRVHCRTARDNLEGWATVSGSQGTIFLAPRSAFYFCVSEAVITDGMQVADSKTVRRVQKGEIVEALDLEKKDVSIGVMRVKCRAIRDGTLGWVTVVGNAGKTFLEPC